MRETTAKRMAMRTTSLQPEFWRVGFAENYKPTTGVVVVEKEASCREGFAEQGEKRKEKRKYESDGGGSLGVKVMLSVEEEKKRKKK
jgi:hypothetical protein